MTRQQAVRRWTHVAREKSAVIAVLAASDASTSSLGTTSDALTSSGFTCATGGHRVREQTRRQLAQRRRHGSPCQGARVRLGRRLRACSRTRRTRTALQLQAPLCGSQRHAALALPAVACGAPGRVPMTPRWYSSALMCALYASTSELSSTNTTATGTVGGRRSAKPGLPRVAYAWSTCSIMLHASQPVPQQA